MGEGKERKIPIPICLQPHEDRHAKGEEYHWVTMEDGGGGEDIYSTSSLDNSSESSCSLDMADDASSPTSSSSSSSSNCNSPLFQLSDLMANLPIKRGLSNHYEGKSRSFISLSSVSTIEDLAKKEMPFRKKLKTYKSYGNGLDAHNPYTLPKAIISKKASRGGSISSLSFPSRKGSFMNLRRPPLVPVQKKF